MWDSIFYIGVYMDFKPETLEGTSDINSNNLMDAVIGVINWLLGFTALAAIIILVYAGINMIWKSDRADEAKKYRIFVKSVIGGLIIILLAYAIVSWLIMPSTTPVLNTDQQI